MGFCSADELEIMIGSPEDGLFPLRKGVTAVSCDFSQDTRVRRLVDGYKTVPMSDMSAVTVKFLRCREDAAQNFLLAAADSSAPVAFSCSDGGFSRSGEALAVISRVASGEVWGIEYTVVLYT